MLLGACAPAATPAPTAMPAPTTAPAAPAATQAPAPTSAPATAATAAVPTNLPRNQTLFISGAAWGPASTWNPFQTGNLANTSGTIGFVYETLFSFDPLSGKLSPFLAASGTWTNPTTYDVILQTWPDLVGWTAPDSRRCRVYLHTWQDEYCAVVLLVVDLARFDRCYLVRRYSRGIHLHQSDLPGMGLQPL